VFRSDLHREALAGSGLDLPLESSRIEGAFAAETATPSVLGRLVLPRNQFFDRRIFDPAMGN
jgi:NitT/TauT family transport system ATP-binding protein